MPKKNHRCFVVSFTTLSVALSVALFVFCPAVFGQESEAGTLPPNEEKIAAVADGTAAEALASWWGFNSADATDSLQAALDSGVKVLRIDKQSGPWNVTTLRIPSDIEIVIDPGVTVQAKEGAFRERDAVLLSARYQKNIVLRGSGADSVLRMRKSDYLQEPYEKAEWRHGISLCAVKNVRIENLAICSTGGDGIYVGAGGKGAPCEDVTIRGVICDDNNRQGISVISAKNLLVEGCVLSNTHGTRPESGIDFEPNDPNDCLINCVTRDCVMENNGGDGIELWLGQLKGGVTKPVSLLFENCVCRDNGRTGYYEEIIHHDNKVIQGEVTLRDCQLLGNRQAGIRSYSKSPDAHDFRLEGVTIDMNGAYENADPIRLICKNDPIHPPVRRPVGGIVWDITIIDPAGRAPISFSDDTGQGFGMFDISGKLTLKKNADDPGEVITVDEKWLAEHFPGVREVSETEEAPAAE